MASFSSSVLADNKESISSMKMIAGLLSLAILNIVFINLLVGNFIIGTC